MTRVKGGVISLKRRHNVLKQTKGFRGQRGTKERAAREAIVHAGAHAFAHRKDKKNDFRRLWQTCINAALMNTDLSYSAFMGRLKKKNILLNRKMLAEMAEKHPDTFARVVENIQ